MLWRNEFRSSGAKIMRANVRVTLLVACWRLPRFLPRGYIIYKCTLHRWWNDRFDGQSFPIFSIRKDRVSIVKEEFLYFVSTPCVSALYIGLTTRSNNKVRIHLVLGGFILERWLCFLVFLWPRNMYIVSLIWRHFPRSFRAIELLLLFELRAIL